MDNIGIHLDDVRKRVESVSDSNAKKTALRKKLKKTHRKLADLRPTAIHYAQRRRDVTGNSVSRLSPDPKQARTLRKQRIDLSSRAKSVKKVVAEIHKGFQKYMKSITMLFPLWNVLLADEHMCRHRKLLSIRPDRSRD
jgi:hypothetical protein